MAIPASLRDVLVLSQAIIGDVESAERFEDAQYRIAAGEKYIEIGPAADIAAETHSSAAAEIIELRAALLEAVHVKGKLQRAKDAHDALQVAAYREAEAANLKAQQAQNRDIFPEGSDGIDGDDVRVAIEIKARFPKQTKRAIAREWFKNRPGCNELADKSLTRIRAHQLSKRIVLPMRRKRSTSQT